MIITLSNARRLLVAALCATLLIAPGAGGLGGQARAGAIPAHGMGWTATWAASPMAPTSLLPNQAVKGFDNQTVRNIIFTSIGGSELRVRLSNAFGRVPVRVARTSVSLPLSGSLVAPGTEHHVFFGGNISVTLPPGGEVVSDPVPMTTTALEELVVDVWLKTATGPATYHYEAGQTSYVATGDMCGDPSMGATVSLPSWYFVDGVDVRGSGGQQPGAVVAFGDSITDGHGSQVGANDRWPNDLARRLDARLGSQAPGVIDEGIDGNRVLSPSACFGPSALARMRRDVLGQPGARWVLVLEGINDIGFSQEPDKGCTKPNTNITAAQLIEGYRMLITEAHAQRLKIIGCTITPFKGSSYWSPAGEAKREAVNNWIRTSGAFDAVVDFARAVQNPIAPQYLNPAYNSGDNLHPNDAGYRAMANAINLTLLK